MYYSQIRFSCRKAKNACDSGKMDVREYEELKKYLFHVIEDFWPDWPNPDGKRFRYSEDGDINHAIRNILFDDAMLTEKGPFNYMILNGREEREQESRVEKRRVWL